MMKILSGNKNNTILNTLFSQNNATREIQKEKRNQELG